MDDGGREVAPGDDYVVTIQPFESKITPEPTPVAGIWLNGSFPFRALGRARAEEQRAAVRERLWRALVVVSFAADSRSNRAGVPDDRWPSEID